MPATAKGTVVKAGHDYMKSVCTEDQWLAVLGRLTAEERSLVMHCDKTVRFPVAIDGKIFAGFVGICCEGNLIVAERVLRRGGATQADDMLNGVFSIFARIVSPKQAFGRAGSIITSVYEGVSAATLPAPDGRGGAVHLRGLGESDFIAPWHCGWMERALGRFGADSPQVTERAWSAGTTATNELVYLVRWK